MTTKAINITNQSLTNQLYIIKALSYRMLQPLIIISILLLILSILCFSIDKVIIAYISLAVGIISSISLYTVRMVLIKEISKIIDKKRMLYEFHINEKYIKVLHKGTVRIYCHKRNRKSYIINKKYMAVMIFKYKYILINMDAFVLGNSQVLTQIFEDNKVKIIHLSIPFTNQ